MTKVQSNSLIGKGNIIDLGISDATVQFGDEIIHFKIDSSDFQEWLKDHGLDFIILNDWEHRPMDEHELSDFQITDIGGPHALEYLTEVYRTHLTAMVEECRGCHPGGDYGRLEVFSKAEYDLNYALATIEEEIKGSEIGKLFLDALWCGEFSYEDGGLKIATFILIEASGFKRKCDAIFYPATQLMQIEFSGSSVVTQFRMPDYFARKGEEIFGVRLRIE